MKRIRRFMRSPKTTVIVFGLAVVLLLFSSIGGTRAALTYFSETYTSRMNLRNIGVTLMEKNDGKDKVKDVAFRDYADASDGTWDERGYTLLDGMLAGEPDGRLKVGKKYNEELSVRNSGEIDQYVRVSIYRYWGKDTKEGEKPEKYRKLDPSLIDLNLVNAGGAGSLWLIDEAASTKERTVLYYSKVLRAGDTTEPFSDTLKIDGMAAGRVSREVIESGGHKTVKTSYDYDGVKFYVEAKVDAVQDHNAKDAIWSAWGRRVTVGDDKDRTLSLD